MCCLTNIANAIILLIQRKDNKKSVICGAVSKIFLCNLNPNCKINQSYKKINSNI